MFTFTDALILAAKAHRDVKDKGGVDYIKHPLHLAHVLKVKGASNEAQITALMHDVVEDVDLVTLSGITGVATTLSGLSEIEAKFVILETIGVPECIMIALRLLTHVKDYEYIKAKREGYIKDGMPRELAKIRANEDEYLIYIHRIAKNALASEVKVEDLTHNSDITRVSDKDIDTNGDYIGRRAMKYAKSRRILTGHRVGY
jgi:guanosine-3',5'-bis(diphosphate) 3'-pyrophosphohydrolase